MLIVVAGTGTDIGKTWVTAATARALRARGVDVCVRKPVQSFAEHDRSTDADVLGAASGEDVHVVCPEHRWYATPMAPPMAADALGLPGFGIADLVAELGEFATDTVTFVEGVGGLRSPIADDGDTLTLIDELHPDLVLLVADARLGAINLVRLCVDALRGFRVAVYLNRFDEHDDLQRRNHEWLVERELLDVVTDANTFASTLAP